MTTWPLRGSSATRRRSTSTLSPSSPSRWTSSSTSASESGVRVQIRSSTSSTDSMPLFPTPVIDCARPAMKCDANGRDRPRAATDPCRARRAGCRAATGRARSSCRTPARPRARSAVGRTVRVAPPAIVCAARATTVTRGARAGRHDPRVTTTRRTSRREAMRAVMGPLPDIGMLVGHVVNARLRPCRHRASMPAPDARLRPSNVLICPSGACHEP